MTTLGAGFGFACGLAGTLALGACYADFHVVNEGIHAPATPEAGDGGSGGDSGGGGSVAEEPEAGRHAGGAGGSSAMPIGCTRGRAVLVGHVANARDLGGLPVAGGGTIACGALYRGGPMKWLSSAGCTDVERLGLRTVIDLRMPTEARSSPTSACVEATPVLAPLPIPYELSAAAYLRDLDAADSIATAFRAFGDADAYPVYFHCTYGRDRTGVVGALLLLALGVAPADVMADYMLSQTTVGAYPDSLQAVLDEIEARGGAETVLMTAGVTRDEIDALRSRVIVQPP